MTTFRRFRLAAPVLLGLLLAAPPASAGKPAKGDAKAAKAGPEGEWDGTSGRVEIVRSGDKVLGRLVQPADGVKLPAASDVLQGSFLEDTLSAEVRVGALVPACGDSKQKAYVVLLLTKKGKLTGGVTAKAKCAKDASVATFVRATGAAAAPMVGERPAEGTYDPRGQRVEQLPTGVKDLMSQAKDRLEEGGAGIEAARKLFQKAIEKDPTIGEAYNGVGITYYVRNDWDAAIEWYKKGLEAAPGFGDLYYNMACSYALKGKKPLALRYLRLAATKGYTEVEALDGDTDLESLREEPEFKEIREQMVNPPPPVPD